MADGDPTIAFSSSAAHPIIRSEPLPAVVLNSSQSTPALLHTVLRTSSIGRSSRGRGRSPLRETTGGPRQREAAPVLSRLLTLNATGRGRARGRGRGRVAF